MTIKTKLRNAIDSIDNAIRKLQRVRYEMQDDTDIIRAIRDLEESQNDIRRALRETNE